MKVHSSVVGEELEVGETFHFLFKESVTHPCNHLTHKYGIPRMRQVCGRHSMQVISLRHLDFAA